MLKIKFRFSAAHKDDYNRLEVLNNIFIDLTNRCNMKCFYCYNNASIIDNPPVDLPLETLEKLITDNDAANVSNWFLSGGEPLLYPSLDKLLQLFQRNGISPKIATNGSLLTPKVVDKFVSYGVGSVQVSIDTFDETIFHQINRSKPGVLGKTLDNLKYVIKSPLRTVVSSTLTSLNYRDVPSILLSLLDMGVDSYTTYLLTPGSDSHQEMEHDIDKSRLPGLIDRLMECYHKNSPVKIIDINFPWFLKSEIYKKWKEKVELRYHGCGAGLFTLSVKANGDASPCICQGSEEFVCGNVKHASIGEIWESEKLKSYRSNYLEIPECEGCEYLRECRGGCRNNAFVFGNRGMKSFDRQCNFF